MRNARDLVSLVQPVSQLPRRLDQAQLCRIIAFRDRRHGATREHWGSKRRIDTRLGSASWGLRELRAALPFRLDGSGEECSIVPQRPVPCGLWLPLSPARTDLLSTSGFRASRNESAANKLTSPWNRFVPDKVTTLRFPPAPPPNSGATFDVVTRNSATASCPIATRLDPVVSSRLSRPSMSRLLSCSHSSECEAAIRLCAPDASFGAQGVRASRRCDASR
jgi:hypothetical protein